MTPLTVAIEGIGAWTPGLADWPAVAAWLRGERERVVDAAARPGANLLPAAERRRAPPVVRMAIEAATQAVAMSGRDAATLPSVFASAFGSVDIMDRICSTLARAPTELSPTQFHNSVHNAAAGYWTIATGCHEASSALTAERDSFALGLLEASLQVVADARPVLLVIADAEADGPLADAVASTQRFAAAMVLAPTSPHATGNLLNISLDAGNDDDPPQHIDAAALAAATPAARALTVLEAIALGHTRQLHLSAAPRGHVSIRLTASDGCST